jgi:hypothetical protein
MAENSNRGFDEMFAASQKNNFPNPNHPKSEPVTQGAVLKQGEYQQEYIRREEVPGDSVTVMNPDRTPAVPKRDFFNENANIFGIVSLVCAAVAFTFVFVGMFTNPFLWIGLLLCLCGMVLSVITLVQRHGSKPLGVIGLAACILSFVFDVICMVVLAITSGIFGLINLFS